MTGMWVALVLAVQLVDPSVFDSSPVERSWVDLTTDLGSVRIFLDTASIKGSGAERTAAVWEWMPYGYVAQVLQMNCSTKKIQFRESDKPSPEENKALAAVDRAVSQRICTKDFKALRHMDHREFLNGNYNPVLAALRAAFVQMSQDKVFAHGSLKPKPIPGDQARELRLSDDSKDYAVCGAAWVDDNDQSFHSLWSGADRNGIILTFKPPDGSYAVAWHLDKSGSVIAARLADAQGVRLAQNVGYSDELVHEISYWKKLLTERKVLDGKPRCAMAHV